MENPGKRLWSDEVSADNMYFSIDVNKRPLAGCIAEWAFEEGKEYFESIRREGAAPVHPLPLKKKEGKPHEPGMKGRMAIGMDDDPWEVPAEGGASGKPRYDFGTMRWLGALAGMDCSDHEFVWDGFLLGTVGSLVSAGGVGKTFMALQKGLKVAAGADGFDRRGVLYLAAEDPETIVGERVQSILAASAFSGEERMHADRNFAAWSLLAQFPDLLEEKGDARPLVDAIIELSKSYANDPLQLVIFDTLRRFSFENENDGGPMSRLIGIMELLCKELGCSCFFLHHANKVAALNGQMTLQQAARGSSVLTDNIRYQEYMRKMEWEEAKRLGEPDRRGLVPVSVADADERGLYVEWGVSKQNYGFPVEPQWYKRTHNGVLFPVTLGKCERKGDGKKEGGNGKSGAREFSLG